MENNVILNLPSQLLTLKIYHAVYIYIHTYIYIYIYI